MKKTEKTVLQYHTTCEAYKGPMLQFEGCDISYKIAM
jgi:hypothetical protein